MRVSTVNVAIALSFAVTAWGQQSGDNTEVFHFTNSSGPQAMQQVTNGVRVVLSLREVFPQMDAKTLTVQASPSDLALTQWLFQELDIPATPLPPSLQVDRYPGLGGAADQVRVFHLAHASSSQGFQETINAVRTIPEIVKVFPVTNVWSIAARGSQDQLDMAEWVLQQIDQAATAPGQVRPEQKFQTPDAKRPELRVIYFAHAATLQGYQEIVNAIRTIPELTHVFPVIEKHAVVIRGSADRVGLAEWLFAQLDKSGPAPAAQASAVQELSPGADVVRVFFLPSSVTAQSFQEMVNTLRVTTQSPRVFPCRSSGAVAFRGTPTQLAQAESIVGNTAKF